MCGHVYQFRSKRNVVDSPLNQFNSYFKTASLQGKASKCLLFLNSPSLVIPQSLDLRQRGDIRVGIFSLVFCYSDSHWSVCCPDDPPSAKGLYGFCTCWSTEPFLGEISHASTCLRTAQPFLLEGLSVFHVVNVG